MDAAAQAADALLAPRRDELFFSGVFGYAVGAQFPPSWVEGTGYISKGQARSFETNMVFHLPLCLRVPGQWGVGLSDTVVVTEQGMPPTGLDEVSGGLLSNEEQFVWSAPGPLDIQDQFPPGSTSSIEVPSEGESE